MVAMELKYERMGTASAASLSLAVDFFYRPHFTCVL
jgi:hypothetical protein